MNDEGLRKKIKKLEKLGLVMWLFQYRKVSSLVVKFLKETPIKPNQVTCLDIVLFLVSMILVGTGRHICMIIGAILGIFCVYLDYIDGDLARAKGMASQFGKALDSASYYLEQILIPMSITSALFLQTRKEYVLVVGAVVIVNVFMYFVGRRAISPIPALGDIFYEGSAWQFSNVKIGFHTFFETDTRLLVFWLGCVFNQLIYVLFYFLIWSFYEVLRMYLVYPKGES